MVAVSVLLQEAKMGKATKKSKLWAKHSHKVVLRAGAHTGTTAPNCHEELRALAADIGGLWKTNLKSFQAVWKKSVPFLRKIGTMLSRAKALVGHGKWSGWVRRNCPFCQRSASAYMALAKTEPGSDFESAGFKAVLRAATKTRVVPSESGKDDPPIDMYSKLDVSEPASDGLIEQFVVIDGRPWAFEDVVRNEYLRNQYLDELTKSIQALSERKARMEALVSSLRENARRLPILN